MWMFIVSVFIGTVVAQCYINVSSQSVIIGNEFTVALFNLSHPRLQSLKCSGVDVFGQHVADPSKLNRQGVFFEWENGDGWFPSTACSQQPSLVVVQNSSLGVQVVIDAISDCVGKFSQSVTLSLNASSLSLTFSTKISPLAPTVEVVSARMVIWTDLFSVTGLFTKGVVQMADNIMPYFAVKSDPIVRAFMVSPNSSLDLTQFSTSTSDGGVALLSNMNYAPYRSGLQLFFGPSQPAPLEQWSFSVWNGAPLVKIDSSFVCSFVLTPFNHSSPASQWTAWPSRQEVIAASSLYASTLSGLISFQSPGQTQLGISTPDAAYGGMSNFWDPDSFFIISGLLYAKDAFGDDYALNQAEALLNKAISSQLPSGQIAHHFEGQKPVYVAISGATQTGPNAFFILAAAAYGMHYDMKWFASNHRSFDLAIEYLLNMYNVSVGMINAPGPLWMDRFNKSGFTSDTNAIIPHVLRVGADAFELFNGAQKAANLRLVAANITSSMNRLLWTGTHYKTQLTGHDYEDIDANLLAVAFGVADEARALQIFSLVDSTLCTPASSGTMGMWISRGYYDEHSTYGGYTGDSAVALGRVAWADFLARQRMGQYDYNNRLVDSLGEYLFRNTWAPERFTCDNRPSHHPFYHEYGNTYLMILHELNE